jgi:dCTP deaminase
MAILSDSKILEGINNCDIIINPFDKACLGSNSYDVHLSENLAFYKYNAHYPGDMYDNIQASHVNYHYALDSKANNELEHFKISKKGVRLNPGVLYLGTTIEYTETHNCVPFLDGKSSAGRLGMFIHVTAGKGDVGFCGVWTLEIIVVHPLVVYAGMPVGQLIYHTVEGQVLNPYNKKVNAKYNNHSTLPMGSAMHKNIF